MLNPTLIVVHPGAAHRDDFLTTCLLLAEFGVDVPVVRRNPTAEELLNPSVIIADIGGDHNPDLGNFDHHQFPREAEACCSFSLLNQHFGWGLELMSWYEWSVTLDAKGPVNAAKAVGVEGDTMALISPVESVLVFMFSEMETVDGILKDMMAIIGRKIIDRCANLKAEVEILRESASVMQVGELHVLIADGQIFDPASLAVFKEELDVEPAVSFVVDRRGGYSLYRYDDNPQVDFAQIREHELITFAHTSGFCAKTPGCTREELAELVALSTV